MHELSHELRRDLRPAILANQEISRISLTCMDLMISVVKHSIKKYILLNFANLSTILWSRLSEKTHFYF